ncbi:ankyrin repeat protein, partial [Pelagophyceae sp. CCMP2097]
MYLPDPNFTIYGQTPLFYCANNGKVGAVGLLLRWPHSVKLLVDGTSDAGETPFLAACRGGFVEVARKLFHAGADVNAKALDGRSAVWCASSSGQTGVLQWLLD